MNDIYFVESPLQLLSAVSARKKFNTASILIINLGFVERGINNKQIIDLVDDYWEKVYIINKKTNKTDSLMSFLTDIVFLSFKYRGKVNRYFFGEYRNPDMAIFGEIVKPHDKILLDDGSFTITAQKKYIQYGMQPFSKSIKGKFFNLISKGYRAPNLYSFFDLDRFLVTGQVNYFEALARKNICLKKGLVYFFGSKFTESGSMRAVDEMTVLSKVINFYAEFHLCYIPHRDESEGKIEAIEKLGYEIKELAGPAETYFDKIEAMPQIVISYYSTVLYSCFIRFKNVAITTVDVQSHLIRENDRINAKEVYEYYDGLGFEKIIF